MNERTKTNAATATNAEMRAALDSAGSAPITRVEPRLPDLEAKLVASIGGGGEVRGVVLSFAAADRRRTARSRAWFAAVAAASIIAVVASVAALRPAADDSLDISAAESVSVILPDGTTVDGAPGRVLPEGARLDVDGSMTVDGRSYGPGDYLVDDDGRIVRIDTASATTTVTTSTAGTESINPTAIDPAPSSTVPAPTIPPTRPPTRPPVVEPPPSRPPRTTEPAPATTLPVRPEPEPVSSPPTPVRTTTTTTVSRTTTTVGERDAAASDGRGRGG